MRTGRKVVSVTPRQNVVITHQRQASAHRQGRATKCRRRDRPAAPVAGATRRPQEMASVASMPHEMAYFLGVLTVEIAAPDSETPEYAIMPLFFEVVE